MLKLEDALANEQVLARGMVLPMGGHGGDHGTAHAGGHDGDHETVHGQPPARQFACPVKMSGFDFTVRHPAPRRGEHTDEILRAAGYQPGDIAALRRLNAIA